jgi:aminocarboxymuconate-semialdehyde decarboxylase
VVRPRRLQWDIALSFSPPLLNMLKDVVGLDRMLFGTDFPYLRRDIVVRSASEIRKIATLSQPERQAVLHGNAQRLFPRLYARLAAWQSPPSR